MKVDATSMQSSAMAMAMAMAQAHPNRRLKVQRPEQNVSTGSAEKPPEKTETATQQSQAKGVMRLLQEGHFKGVAALRLRINFFDQISDLEQGNLQDTARQGLAELVRTMEEKIGAMSNAGLFEAEPLAQAKELAESFTSELQADVAGEELDPQSMVSILNQAFSEFESALADLLVAPLEEPQQTAESVAGNPAAESVVSSTEPAAVMAPSNLAATESESSVEPPAEPSITLAAGIAPLDELRAGLDGLAATFRNQLSSLQEDLQNTALLSVPEPPDNNGAAYQKFLAIYQQMQGVPPAGEAVPTTNEPPTEA